MADIAIDKESDKYRYAKRVPVSPIPRFLDRAPTVIFIISIAIRINVPLIRELLTSASFIIHLILL
jgi:hypothetical protein